MSIHDISESLFGLNGERHVTDQSQRTADELFALNEQLGEIKLYDANLSGKNAANSLTDAEAAFFVFQCEILDRINHIRHSQSVESFADAPSASSRAVNGLTDRDAEVGEEADLTLKQINQSLKADDLTLYADVSKDDYLKGDGKHVSRS